MVAPGTVSGAYTVEHDKRSMLEGQMDVRASGTPPLDERGLWAACAPAAAYPLLQEFVSLGREQATSRLDPWLDAAIACGVPDVEPFAAGMCHERAPLIAAWTLPWSTGLVEGRITSLQLLKRQGDGRCGLDTLTRRFLHAA